MQEIDPIVVKTVFYLQDECLSIVKELKTVLLSERQALIGLDTQAVVETTAKKDHLGGLLKSKRAYLWRVLKTYYALEDSEGLEEKLREGDRAQWLIRKQEWIKNWDETTKLVEANQRFLKHSLRNFDLLADNLKRLLGEQPLYSAKGQKVDLSSPGKMVEGKY